eukprot:scaffold156338_cov115-Cyclotella_meneghiniana.AAC.2
MMHNDAAEFREVDAWIVPDTSVLAPINHVRQYQSISREAITITRTEIADYIVYDDSYSFK